MQSQPVITANRLETFSDGVIAIIITIMVFDLKFANIPTADNLRAEARVLLPKLSSYALSFLTLAIMWVNHHQLFHQVRQTDRRLLWLNLHLLFWMSLVPFVTNLLGASPWLPQSSAAYGLIFFLCAFSFTLLRNHTAGKMELRHAPLSTQLMRRTQRRNRLGMGLYLLATLAAFVSVYLSFACFLIVPAMYFIPEKINHER